MRDVSISSFFYLELRLRPEGTVNFERIVLPLVCIKIAGSVPTWTSPQALESEVWASESAAECPHLVEGRCPHAGTRSSGELSTFPAMMKIQTGADTLTISSDSRSSHPRMRGGFRKSPIVPDGRGIEAIGANVETDHARRGYGCKADDFERRALAGISVFRISSTFQKPVQCARHGVRWLVRCA